MTISPSIPSGEAPAPWFGRSWEHRHAAVAGMGSLTAGLIYLGAAQAWAPQATPGWVEFWGTVTSLWSVWITQRRNVLALPVGIVSVMLMGWVFLNLDLIGQTWLHWAYYLPVQLWAWQQWTRGGIGGSELTVTYLPRRARWTLVLALVVGTIVLGWALETTWTDALHTYWDASIVAASIIAMGLLSRKKVESWWFWILPVNVSAAGLYLLSGAYMFAALYCLFLGMAVVGLWRWRTAAASCST